MKQWEWIFLTILASIVLIISFITKNIYVVLGTFLFTMYLRKYYDKYKFKRPD